MPVTALKVETLQEIVIGKCDSFVSMGIWPGGKNLTPRKWLNNFTHSEKEHALYLLNSFVYFNLDMAIALLKGSFLNLAKYLPAYTSITQRKNDWNKFLNRSVFIPVTGELRNVTDSGNIIAGYLRRELKIKEENILTIDNLYDLSYVTKLKKFERVIFFDDFVGSGEQFLTMWTGDFVKELRTSPAVEFQCSNLKLVPFYCGMIATTYGIGRIINKAPKVNLSFAHILMDNASPIHPDSNVWPVHLKATSFTFIMQASERANIPKTQIMGFHNLGLALAFSFTIPDATLPIFSWRGNNWTPLMEKS